MTRKTNLSRFLSGVMLLISAAMCGANELTVLPAPSDDALMTRYLRNLAHQALERRAAKYEKLKTPEQIEAYQQRLRSFFVEQLGGWPDRTPLNARVVRSIGRDGYRVEKIIYESQPGFFVTAAMYLPNSDPPYPAVLVPCGHSAVGKAEPAYQRACILLATNGMAALCYDPIGQGERYQILDGEGKPRFGATHEHTLVGVGCILIGTNTARYRIWDGMRGIDYLVSRDDIDPKRIGCSGNSGGGTLTSYIGALDSRVVCSAPSCYLCGFDFLMDAIGPQDAEQNIHAQLAGGMDHADYLIMRAPAPTLICAATQDFFDINATWRTFRQAKRLYARMGFAERMSLVETDAKHGFSTELRVGMVRWMRRWLLDIDEAVTEPERDVMSEADLRCTPDSQVLLMDGVRSVFDLNAALEEQLAGKRKAFWQDAPRDKLIASVRKTIGAKSFSEMTDPDATKVGVVERKEYKITKLILQPADGIALPSLLFEPDNPKGNIYLYCHGQGKHIDASTGGAIEKLVLAGNVVLVPDLCGIGETESSGQYKGWADLFGPDWQDFFRAYLVDKSYAGMRTEDIYSCVRFLKSKFLDQPIHLVGIGEASVPALHAAAIEADLFASLRLDRSIRSWAKVVRSPVTKNQLINTVHGVLRTYDLPDLLPLLPAEKVTIIDPVDPQGQPIQ